MSPASGRRSALRPREMRLVEVAGGADRVEDRHPVLQQRGRVPRPLDLPERALRHPGRLSEMSLHRASRQRPAIAVQRGLDCPLRRIRPAPARRATNVSALSKAGNSHCVPFNQNARAEAAGRSLSLRSRRRARVMRHESAELEANATHSPSAGQCTLLALVSGPRIVSKARPRRRVTTISHWLAPIDRNVPARSLWHRHTLSTNGESEGRGRRRR